MVVLTNASTPEKVDNKTVDNKLVDAMKKEIETYWKYVQMVKGSEDNQFIWALWEMMEDEYLHARYFRKYMMEHDMYDEKSDYEEKYRDMVVDKMIHRYGWND